VDVCLSISMGANSFSSNQGTQSALLTDNTGGLTGTLIPIMKISTDQQGTFTAGNIWNGQLGTIGTVQNLLGGTLTSLLGGTLNQLGNLGTLPNLPGGSIVVTAGTIGTISNIGSIGVLTTGNLGTVGTIQNILGGTLTSVLGGTINQINNIGTLPKGTIALGSIGGIDANAAAQTANPVSIGGTDSGGTVRTILINAAGAMNIGTVSALPNLPQGSINVTAGTIGTITNVGQIYNAGTLQTGANTIGNIGTLITGTILSSGTTTGVGTMTNLGSVTNLGQVYNAGTVQNILGGTVQLSPIPTISQSTYGTHGTTGVSVFGTLAGGTGSGAGTEIFVTSVSMSIPSTGGSQDVSIGWGTNAGTFQAGTGLIVRGNFPPGGGIQKTFSPAINSGTNAQLCLFQAGAGTVDVNVTYFITTSTL
jgi:hypothetical protein